MRYLTVWAPTNPSLDRDAVSTAGPNLTPEVGAATAGWRCHPEWIREADGRWFGDTIEAVKTALPAGVGIYALARIADRLVSPEVLTE